MEQISRIGMDTSKHFFQLHGVNAAEKVVLRKKLRRKEMVAFFKALAPTVIGIEACGAAHYLARLLGSFGHEVKLIAPQLVKPYVKRGKNDGADAEALCEAMSRPSMRFVPVKTAEQQAALMMCSSLYLILQTASFWRWPVHCRWWSGSDHFFPRNRDGVKECLQRRLAEAPAALMRSLLVVAFDP